MTKVAVYISVLLLLAVVSVGASRVTNIELSKAGGFTTARIDVDGQIRFTHQTEEAKDGRPFRVIVDILSATHELGAKVFPVLPNCLIKGIRTSQFSVKPEQVVRIVFDMNTSPIYRVEPDKNSISVFFTDQSGADFGPWSSAEFVKKTKSKAAVKKQFESTPPVIALTPKEGPKSAASQNKAIASDRWASLEGEHKPAPKTAYKPEISKASVQRASNVKVPPKPEIDAVLAALDELPATKSMHNAQSKPKPVADSKGKAVSKQVHSKLTTKPSPSIAVKRKSVSVAPAPAPAPKAAKKTDTKPKKDKTKPLVRAAVRSTVKVGTGPIQGPPPPPQASELSKQKVTVKDTRAELTATSVNSRTTPKKQTGIKTVVQHDLKQPAAKKVAHQKTKPTKSKKVAKVPGDKNAEVVTVAKASKQPATKKVALKKAVPAKVGKVVRADQGKKAKVVSIAKDSKPASKEKSTSRFRRKPVVSNKIKGTLVAQFPKRLTIKYRARSSHDPFETLINENRRYNEPLDKKVPNVEGLRLVGVIESDNGKNSALFEDKDGFGYILQSGDKVRKGYVLRVESDRVYFQIFEYGWSRTMALKMEEY